jgi:dihydropteroate synthase
MRRGEDSKVSWRLKDRLLEPGFPLVMGILNATPDSFFAGSRVALDDLLARTESMVKEGATILDIGGASSRPGAKEISVQEEMDRVLPAIERLHAAFPEALLSVDTYRSDVARHAVQAGARMVNDIGASLLDENMLATVAELHVLYVIMHMQGIPATMQKDPQYNNVVKEVTLFLSQRLNAARSAGIADVIIDPGFGFGKTTDHNFALLRGLPTFLQLGVPVMVGLSRKRMINEVLGTTPSEALNGTSVLNTLALVKGAHILRVHDVKEAVECVKLVERFQEPAR